MEEVLGDWFRCGTDALAVRMKTKAEIEAFCEDVELRCYCCWNEHASPDVAPTDFSH